MTCAYVTGQEMCWHFDEVAVILYYSNQGGTAGIYACPCLRTGVFCLCMNAFLHRIPTEYLKEGSVVMERFAAHKSGKIRNNDFDKAREKYWRWSLRL